MTSNTPASGPQPAQTPQTQSNQPAQAQNQPQQAAQPASTHAPNTPKPLPEFESEVLKLWREELPIETQKKISWHTRKTLQSLLGKEVMKKIPKRPEALVVYDIYQRLYESRKGFLPYIQRRNPGSVRLRHYKKPKQRWYNVPGKTWRSVVSGRDRYLQDVISDTKSREAQALAWLWNIVATNENAADLSTAFSRLERKEDATNAATLKKMKELFEQLADDDENYNLGKEGTGIPPTGGAGRIFSSQLLEHNYTDQASHIPRAGNPTPFLERAEKAGQDFSKSKRKKSGLERNLRKLEQYAKSLNPAPTASWGPADIVRFTEDFNPSEILNHAFFHATNTEIAGKQATIDKWLANDKLPNIADSLQHASVGKSRAANALDKLIKMHFGPSTLGMKKEDQERFFHDMRTTLTSAQAEYAVDVGKVTGALDAPREPSFERKIASKTTSAGKATAKGIWHFFTGSTKPKDKNTGLIADLKWFFKGGGGSGGGHH